MSRLRDIDDACSELLRRSLTPQLKACIWHALAAGHTPGEVLRLVERAGARRNSLTWLACSYEVDAAIASIDRGDPPPLLIVGDAPPADDPSSAGA